MPKIVTLLILITLGFLFSCSEEKLRDVSEEPEFKGAIGSRYEVVGTLHGYGIKRHSRAEVEYITLIPPPGIGGSEVGFRVPISAGSKITVIKVLRTNRWIDPNISLVVQLEGTQMPVDAIVRIELFRGNEGKGLLQLNPGIYQKMSDKE